MIFIFYFVQLFSVLSGNQNPVFEHQTIDSAVAIGYGIALGDVDGDKKPDILLADKKQFVWYRNGDWKRFVMAQNLTASDNVCIAAEDIDGDGKVEVAVGAQWNPSETQDPSRSGSVHFLVRPQDPTHEWKPIELYHEVTIHRMRWMKPGGNSAYLLVLPLHGKDNKGGTGTAVNLLVFQYPRLLETKNAAHIISTDMHLTHNLDIAQSTAGKLIYIAGKEGVSFLNPKFDQPSKPVRMDLKGTQGAGELRISNPGSLLATIEPMHGNQLVVYTGNGNTKLVLDSNLNEGHALAIADVLGVGHPQVVAGWRRPNKDGKVGIKLYSRKSLSSNEWQAQWIDDNGMACEDLQVMDMNGDGKPDIVASGRATNNLKIYWNRGR